MKTESTLPIATDILDILPNPVLVKNEKLEYVFINTAFENLFAVKRENVIGRLDAELFPNRQVSQCNGGDLRVLESGAIDEATETVFDSAGNTRETITRKNRLTTDDGQLYLVGIMHDVTDITRANIALKASEVKLQEHAQKLAELASTDSLTGCANRRALSRDADTILMNQFSSSALLLVDLDNFKSINDLHGHEAGDTTLQHFAELVRQQLGQQDLFARIGGEEFVLLLVGATTDEALDKAECIRKQVAAADVKIDDRYLRYTVSIGVEFKPKGVSTQLESLLSSADKRLYQAKNQGRNRVVSAA